MHTLSSHEVSHVNVPLESTFNYVQTKVYKQLTYLFYQKRNNSQGGS